MSRTGIRVPLSDETLDLVRGNDVAINHVDDFQLASMQIVGRGGAGVVHDHHAEAFIGEGADRGADALIGENASNDYVGDTDIVQHQPEIGAGQRAVGSLGDRDLVAFRRERIDDLAVVPVLGKKKVVEARFFLTE